jgi:chromosome partitioning protein
MSSILVASSKGGCGKSTLSTHLAAHFCVQGQRTALVDLDPQGSSLRWCQRRTEWLPAPVAIDGTQERWHKAMPEDVQQVVIDAPAGSTPDTLKSALKRVDVVLVPVLPAPFDLEATAMFLSALSRVPRVSSGELPIALIANRVRPTTQASQRALAQLHEWPYPVLAELRDSQSYVLLTALGKSLFDYGNEVAQEQQSLWQGVFAYLRKLERRVKPTKG